MRVKIAIKKKLLKTHIGTLFINNIRRLREKVSLWQYSDIRYIENVYKQRFKNKINLNNPSTFQEKLQWLKLFYRNNDIAICSDKYELHNYLKRINLGYLGNEIIGIFNNANEIDFSKLPNKFVAKATHGSGWNLICEDKTLLDINYTKKLLNSWMRLNLYVFGREWNYKNIKPRIIIEKFLDYKPLNDYKFMCYNGIPLYIQLNNDYNGVHYVDFFELKKWEHLPVTYGPYICSDRSIDKPPMFNEMMELAKELSKPFPFVRVDFYNFNKTIILGELTFFPGGGLWPFTPREMGKTYDIKIGEPLVLPKANYNLELLNNIRINNE